MNIHKHALTYSMAAVFAAIVVGLGVYLADLHQSFNYLSYAAYTAFAVFALKSWRDKAKGGYLTFGQGMGCSTWMAVYYSIAMTIWTYVFMTYIAPGLLESQMIKSEEMMEAKGLPPEQIEMAMKMTRTMMKPGVIAGFSLVGNMFFLTIINLIVVAVVKKDPPVSSNFNFPQQPSDANNPFANNPYANNPDTN